MLCCHAACAALVLHCRSTRLPPCSPPTNFHPPTHPSCQFVFLDKEGKPLAAAVGKLPREVLAGNTAALAEGRPLPFARVQAEGASALQRPDGAMAGPQRQAGPLDHGP